MKKFIDAFYIAAEIRLTRQVHLGTILILEGPGDFKALRRFIDDTLCSIEIAFGKDNVIKALDLLEDEGFPGVIALVDADFDGILEKTYHLENLCVTDFHDLDLTIFYSSAFDTYISEHADMELVKKNFNSDLSCLRDHLVRVALPFAYCRLVSKIHNLRLSFTQLIHDEFVDKANLTVNIDAFVAAVLRWSRPGPPAGSIKALMDKEQQKNYAPRQLANGHDVSAIFGIALRKLVANRRDVHTWAREIESGLRLSFDWEALRTTTFYRCLHAWELNNEPYRIFLDVPSRRSAIV